MRHCSFRISLAFAATVVVNSLVAPQVSKAAPPGPMYAQLSSGLSQKASAEGTLVTMDSNDALGGLVHDDKGKSPDVVIKADGVYFMVAAIQVGQREGECRRLHRRLDEAKRQRRRQLGLPPDAQGSQVHDRAGLPGHRGVQGRRQVQRGDFHERTERRRRDRQDRPEGRAGHPEHHLFDLQDRLNRDGYQIQAFN